MVDLGEVFEKILFGVRVLSDFYFDFLKKEKEVDWVFFLLVVDMVFGVCIGRYCLGKDEMIVDMVGNSYIFVEDYVVVMIDEFEKLEYY